MKMRPFISATSTCRSLAARDQLRRLVELGRNAEVAREMVERAERQDAERRLGPDQRRGRRADRAVAAADDQQLVAALGDRPAARRAVAAVDQLDLGVDARLLQRLATLSADLRVGRRRRRRRG